jgi:hypothetical protein
MSEGQMTGLEVPQGRKRRRAASTAELFAALEGLLPFAAVEIDCLAGYVESFSDDPDHEEDAERVKRGQAAIALARSLLDRKSHYLRRRVEELNKEVQADA